MKRTIIIHGHIFKNAGSTLDWSLKRFFGDAFLDHRDDMEMRRGAVYLDPFVRDNMSLKAISTHHLQFPLPLNEDIDYLPIVLLRHPIDRAASAYQFERKQKAATPGAINAKKMSFSEYVIWRMNPSVGNTIRNYQTSYCSPMRHGKKTRANASDFNAALDFITTHQSVGIVEKYDVSMAFIECGLRKYFPTIDLSYVRQNTTRADDVSLENRIKNIRGQLGDDVYDLLCENNEYDMLLYKKANELLQQRIKLMDIDSYLSWFQNRCSQTQNLVTRFVKVFS